MGIYTKAYLPSSREDQTLGTVPGVWQTLSHCQLLLLLVTEQLLLEEQVSMKPWTGFSDV